LFVQALHFLLTIVKIPDHLFHLPPDQFRLKCIIGRLQLFNLILLLLNSVRLRLIPAGERILIFRWIDPSVCRASDATGSIIRGNPQIANPQILKCPSSVSVRLAVPAVVAANGRLDQAGAVSLGAGRHRQHEVAGVRTPDRRRRDGTRMSTAQVTSDRLANQIAQLIVSHSL
jgi:hypothetical protein